MKNKGYTLVEVLAVIVILGLLVAIIVPTLDSVIDSNKKRSYDLQVKLLLTGLEEWGAANVFKLPENEGEFLIKKVGELKKEGFLDNDLRNPITDSCISNDLELMIVRKNNKYVYSLVDEEMIDGSESDCE